MGSSGLWPICDKDHTHIDLKWIVPTPRRKSISLEADVEDVIDFSLYVYQIMLNGGERTSIATHLVL